MGLKCINCYHELVFITLFVGGLVSIWSRRAVLAAGLSVGWAGAAMAKPSPLTVGVVGGPQVGTWPLWLAHRLSFLDQHGLQVQIRAQDELFGSAQTLTQGRLQAWIGPLAAQWLWPNASPNPYKPVLAMTRSPQLALGHMPRTLAAAQDERPSLQTIAVPQWGGHTHWMAQGLATRMGWSMSHVRWVSMDRVDRLHRALLTQDVQGFALDEPMLSALEVEADVSLWGDLRRVDDLKQWLGGELPGHCLWVHETWAKDHPKAVQALVSALERAKQWLLDASVMDVVATLGRWWPQWSHATWVRAWQSNRATLSADGALTAAHLQRMAKLWRDMQATPWPPQRLA